jgi:hypothetical protein
MAPMASPARKLTVHQQAVLIQVLRAFPEQQVAVEYAHTVDDARSYAHDFLTIFKAVGWTVSEAQPFERLTQLTASLALIIGQDQRLPPAAEAFRDALRIYGMEAEPVSEPGSNINPGSFTLSVGANSTH